MINCTIIPPQWCKIFWLLLLVHPSSPALHAVQGQEFCTISLAVSGWQSHLFAGWLLWIWHRMTNLDEIEIHDNGVSVHAKSEMFVRSFVLAAWNPPTGTLVFGMTKCYDRCLLNRSTEMTCRMYSVWYFAFSTNIRVTTVKNCNEVIKIFCFFQALKISAICHGAKWLDNWTSVPRIVFRKCSWILKDLWVIAHNWMETIDLR